MYQLERRDIVTSTNDLCMKRGRDGGSGNYVITATMQTKGRGRNGRTWDSPQKDGLYLSILERPTCSVAHAPQLSLIMGMAAAKAIQEVCGYEPQLKWPNDLVIKGKKLSGILAQMQLRSVPMQAVTDEDGSEKKDSKEKNSKEKNSEKEDSGTMEVEYVVIGIGVNLFQTHFPEEIRKTATSLLLEGFVENIDEEGRVYFREKMENAIVKWWETYYNQFMQEGAFAGFVEEYQKMCANVGKRVKVLDPRGEYTGECLGVNQEGELLVRDEAGKMHSIQSGEVSVRGIYGYIE